MISIVAFATVRRGATSVRSTWRDLNRGLRDRLNTCGKRAIEVKAVAAGLEPATSGLTTRNPALLCPVAPALSETPRVKGTSIHLQVVRRRRTARYWRRAIRCDLSIESTFTPPGGGPRSILECRP